MCLPYVTLNFINSPEYKLNKHLQKNPDSVYDHFLIVARTRYIYKKREISALAIE